MKSWRILSNYQYEQDALRGCNAELLHQSHHYMLISREYAKQKRNEKLICEEKRVLIFTNTNLLTNIKLAVVVVQKPINQRSESIILLWLLDSPAKYSMKQMQEEHAEVNKRWASLYFSAERRVEIKNCDTFFIQRTSILTK